MDLLQMKLSVLLWTLFDNLVLTRGIVLGVLESIISESLELHTAQQSNSPYLYTKLSSYGYRVGTSTCIEFGFKGCQDAIIGLMQEDDDSKLMIEIILGGWINKKSVIRLKKYSVVFKEKSDLNGVVDCNESRKFKIGWKDGNITAYRWVRPCQWQVLMSWHNTWYSVNYIGVTSGNWANGDWIISNEECHVPIKGNTLWKNDIATKNIVFSGSIFTRPDVDSSHQCAMQCQRYSDCCYYTYNGEQRGCRGFTETGPSTTSVGTQLWKRY